MAQKGRDKDKSRAARAREREVEFISVKSPRTSHASRPLSEPKPIWAYSAFAVVALIFFFAHLTGSAFFWEDFTEQFFPFQSFAARSFADGGIPFWNPYTFAGMPFYADLQNGMYYPGHLLLYILSGGTLTVWLAQLIVILHYPIAMIGMWMLARRAGIGGWGSILAGIAYGLSGMLVAHMVHPNLLYHLAFFPMIVALFYDGLTRRRLKPLIGGGLLFGCVLLSGHPQMALYIVFYLFCLTLFIVIRDLRVEQTPERKRTLLITALGCLGAVMIAVGIFAIQFLPSQELAAMSQRSEMTYEKSLDGALEMKQLVTLVAPKTFGTVSADPPKDVPFWLRGGGDTYYFWETLIYMGVVTLLLAIVGLASRRLRGFGWFVAGMGLFGIAFALGDGFLIHPIVAKLPLFGSFRIPTRMAMYAVLAGPLLAGAGLDALLKREGDAKSMRLATLIGGGVIILIALLAATGVLSNMLGAPAELIDALKSTAIAPLLIGIVAVAIVWFALRGSLPPIGTAISLIILAIIDLFSFGLDQNQSPTNPADVYDKTAQDARHLVPSSPDSLFRIQMRGTGQYGGAMLMRRNQGPYNGIMLVEGYNPLVLQRAYPLGPQSMELLNVRYAIDVDSATGAPKGLMERPGAYGHAWLVPSAIVADTAEIRRRMESEMIDYREVVFLEEEPGISLASPRAPTPVTTPDSIVGDSIDVPTPSTPSVGSVTVKRYEPNEIELGVDASAPSILVLSDVYYPAWTTTVDGKEAKTLRANWSLRGVPVEKGKHTVVMRFESSAYGTGKVITIVSLLLGLGALIALILLDRKRKSGNVVVERDGDEG